MTAFSDMTAFSERLIPFLIDITVRASVLLALAAIVMLLFRRASASFRHMTWAFSLGCVLCLPFLSWNLPHWPVPITTLPTHLRAAAALPPPLLIAPKPTPHTTLVQHTSVPVAPGTKAGVGTVGIRSAVALPSAAPEPPAAIAPPTRVPDQTTHRSILNSVLNVQQIPWTAWALMVWLCGTVLMLAKLAQSLLMVRRIASVCSPIAFGQSRDAATQAVEAMHIGRPVALRLASSSAHVTVPFTYGVLRPVLVLPAETIKWPRERLRAALLHEMAHVRRQDWPLQIMAHFVRALYWFNPIVWMAVHRLRTESEAAADDLVLSVGMPAKEYARHLLDVALSARQSRRISQGAVAMAQSPKVEGRLQAVLAQGLSRQPVKRWTGIGFLAAAVLVALPLATMRLAAHGEVVPAADRLQLQGDFTLRYAVTITDTESSQAQFLEYQQLRTDYQRELDKDPYMQPVPPEFYAPFSYFQSRRPRARHLILTVSAQDGKLLWRSQENGHTFALVYNGKDGTQLFSDGHEGRIETGFQFPEMENCPLPAVGLPHLPLFKGATLVNSADGQQTWQVETPLEGAQAEQGKALYTSSRAHAVSAAGTWKVLDVDSSDQRFEFLQHQRFQGLWVASHMILTKYTTNILSLHLHSHGFSSEEEFLAFIDAHRTPNSRCEYQLLSASSQPMDMSTLGMRLATAPTRAFQSPSLDDIYVQEALHLRFHLQGWAMTQKTLLRQMAQAQPIARAALWLSTSLDGLPFPLWQGDPRPGHVWDGDPRIGHDGHKPLFQAERPSAQGKFPFNDFEIARSLDPGASHVILWGSGRITRSTLQKVTRLETQQEVVPAFFGADGTSNMAGDRPQAASNASSSPLAPALKLAVGFRRYTSPLLPDGSRYTFLYPSYYAKVRQGWLDSDYQFGCVRIDCAGTQPVPWIALPGQPPVAYYIQGKQGTSWLAPHEEFCSVIVGSAGNMSFPIGSSSVRDDTQWVGENGSHHHVMITDRRFHYGFELIHEDRYTPALFKQTDPVIFGSFRILPPEHLMGRSPKRQ